MNPYLQLFRPLLPSWRFFDEPGDMPVLLCREGDDAAALGEWCNCVPRPKKSWTNLFLNPQGNYFLAAHSLLEQLTHELSEWDENDPAGFANTVSYRLVERLVRYELARASSGAPPRLFQFKIAAETESGLDDVLLSPILER